VLEAVRRVTGHAVAAVDCPRRAGDPPALVASSERAIRELGWKPGLGIEDMARDAWAFAQKYAPSAG
jgi:UDP-glucose 4-epimerase